MSQHKIILLCLLIISCGKSTTLSYDSTCLLPIPNENGTWGYINQEGEWIIQPSFEAASLFHEGIASVKQYGKWGFVNRKGEWVIQPEFEITSHFEHGFAKAKKESQWYIFNPGGESLSQVSFDPLISPEGLIFFEEDGYFGVVDVYGNEVIPAQFIKGDFFRNGYAAVEDSQGYSWIDKEGKWLTDQRFEWISNVEDGLGKFSLNGKVGFINTLGEIQIPPQFDFASDFSEGMAQIEIQGKRGYINNEGEVVIPARFDPVFGTGFFSEGLASVKIEGKYGFIDRQGDWVITPAYDLVGTFHEGTAWVKLTGHLGLIDSDGNFIFRPEWTSIEEVCDGIFKVTGENVWGYQTLEKEFIWKSN